MSNNIRPPCSLCGSPAQFKLQNLSEETGAPSEQWYCCQLCWDDGLRQHIAHLLDEIKKSMDLTRSTRLHEKRNENKYVFREGDPKSPKEIQMSYKEFIAAGVGYSFGYFDCLFKLRAGLPLRNPKTPDGNL